NGAWAQIETEQQGVGAGALQRIRQALPPVDLWVGAHPGTGSGSEPVTLERWTGPLSAAGGALGVLWAAEQIRQGAVESAAVALVSPLGWASVIVLTCPTT